MSVYPSDHIPNDAPIGGKARNLLELQSAGLNVPKWCVVPSEDLSQLLPDFVRSAQDYNAVRQAIEKTELPSQIVNDIIGLFPGVEYFAVRSSALDEDGSSFSFAGQFESHLYVPVDDLLNRVKRVWLSAYSERVFAYRSANGLGPSQGIAVIVQEMVPADVAGVAFGVNPVTGDRRACVVSAVYGLGEGLVSGELDADTYIVKDLNIERTIIKKEYTFVYVAARSGLGKVDIPVDCREVSTLSDAQVLRIAEILRTLRRTLGKPQDIEFAVYKDDIFLLQTRPITNLHKLPDKSSDYVIWDNSNIVESYPGITLPLTFSFIVNVYEAVYRQFCEMMGVHRTEIEAHARTFANMLGLINGRVYYNLLSWYKVLSLLPGYALNAEFMEKMMGVKERFVLPKGKAPARFREWMRVGYALFKIFGNLVSLPRQRRRFVSDFNSTMAAYEQIDFGASDSNTLMHYYLDYEQTLLKKWKAPLVNDFFAMIYFGVLQKMVLKLNVPDKPHLHNDLLCGSKDIISAEPMHRILELAEAIRANPQTQTLFATGSEKEILNALTEPEHSRVKQLLDGYLQRFGERCVGELKLETITYSQHPVAFIRILKSYAAAAGSSSTQNQNLREDAAAQAAVALKGKPFKRLVFNHVLKTTRSLVSNRENLRYERTRAFGTVRKIFTAIGQNFYAENLTAHPRDIFYLRKEEVFDFIQGTSVNRDLRELIALRQKEFANFALVETAERIRTYGIVYHANDFASSPVATVDGGELTGMGCCAGVVKAKVRVVRDPREATHLGGDILVTSSTDPGWVTLFPSAAGILVERGSLLSHSAIVSREMGKPCIVGITGLLQRLRTGDVVQMDGSTGVVKIIEPADAAA